MAAICFNAAYYIKLGKAGCWEADSIETGKLRIGWRRQSVKDINAGRWPRIKQQLLDANDGKPVTADFNALQQIVESTPADVWITFHTGKLWWGRVGPGKVEEDGVSKFRRMVQPWSDRSGNGRLLTISTLPGRISQTQGFRATACKVKHPEILGRILNGTQSEVAAAISNHFTSLSKLLVEVIKDLHWKDFETLVDLVFRHAGWNRVSVLGQHEKGYDLEVREPITKRRYVVQVKSRATLSELRETSKQFPPNDLEKIFFVVHSPEKSLLHATEIPKHVEFLPPERLGELAHKCGTGRLAHGEGA